MMVLAPAVVPTLVSGKLEIIKMVKTTPIQVALIEHLAHLVVLLVVILLMVILLVVVLLVMVLLVEMVLLKMVVLEGAVLEKILMVMTVMKALQEEQL